MHRPLNLMIVVAALALGACGDEAYTLSEAEGVEVIEAAFTARGYAPTGREFVMADVELCDEAGNCQEPVTVALDGWDATHQVGFEYLSEVDPDFMAHPLLRSANPTVGAINAELLETALNARLAEGAGGTIIVLRNWGHETVDLARGQLESAAARSLDAHGLTGQ